MATETITTGTFEVGGSFGIITALKSNGAILNIPDKAKPEFEALDLFNVQEYCAYYNVTEVRDSVDILDIGYWYFKRNRVKGKKQFIKVRVYEPPSHHWRHETAQMRKGIEP